jgi:hypothetical protein
MNLTDRFRWWALPTDTIRAATELPGLVRAVVYRPANATVIRHRLSLMTGEERGLVRDLSLRHVSATDMAAPALAQDRTAAVLEVAHDYVNYRRAIGAKDVPEPAELARELLVARSRIDAAPRNPPVPVPVVRPDQGHASSRIGLGVGRREEQSYQELQARSTYHDIMDPEGGYIRGAQIQYFDLWLRRYESTRTRVERFVPAEILSLSPRDTFFQSRSWRIAAGWQRMFAADGREPLAFAVDGAAGGTWSSAGGTALAYLLLDGSVRAHGSLDGGYALGTGASVGLLYDATPSWRLHGYARGMRYFLGQRDTPGELGLQQRLTLARDLALRLDLSRRHELDRSFNSATASVQIHF